MLAPGDFFGEGSLAGQSIRIGAATAMAPSSILIISTAEMMKVLHEQHTFSDRFIAHMLTKNLRTEQTLIDQLFNSCEKRLASRPRPNCWSRRFRRKPCPRWSARRARG